MAEDLSQRMEDMKRRIIEEMKAKRGLAPEPIPPSPPEQPTETLTEAPETKLGPSSFEDDERYQKILGGFKNKYPREHEAVFRAMAKNEFLRLYPEDGARYLNPELFANRPLLAEKEQVVQTIKKTQAPEEPETPPEPPPEPEPVPEVEAPPQPPPEELDQKLIAARERYVKAEKAVADLGFTKKQLVRVVKPETYEQIQKALEQAEAEYKKLRAEYVEADVTKFLEEKSKVIEAKLELHAQSRGKFQRAYDWYKTLGKYSAEWGAEKLGFKIDNRFVKTLLRSMNARTAISLGLLGAGLWFGAGSAVGGMAIVGRRLLAGVGRGVGTYDLLNLAKRNISRTWTEAEIKKVSRPEDLENHLAAIESKALLDGKTLKDLQSDELYQKLLGRRQELLEAQAGSIGETKLAEYLQQQLDREDQALAHKLKTEKHWRFFAGVVGAAAGASVWSSELAKAFGRITSLRPAAPLSTVPAAEVAPPPVVQEPPTVQPLEAPATLKPPSPPVGEPPPSAAPPVLEAVKGPETAPGKVELLHGGQPTGASVESQDGKLVLHAGKRGIEGALLDLKEANQAQYNKMIDWLKNNPNYKSLSTDPQANADHRLVHRFILKYAKDHNIEPEKLDKILEGKVTLKPGGSLEIGEGDIRYMAEAPTAKVPEGPSTSSGTIAAESHGEGVESSLQEEIARARKQIQEAAIEGGEPGGTVAPSSDEALAESRASLQKSEELLAQSKASAQKAEEMSKQFEKDRAVHEQRMREMRRHDEEMVKHAETQTGSATSTETPQPVPEVEALDASSSTLSKTLEHLDPQNYQSFLKDVLQIEAGALDQVQNLSVAKFLDEYAKDNLDFHNRYRGLKTVLLNPFLEKFEHLGEDYLATKKLRDVIIDFADLYFNALKK